MKKCITHCNRGHKFTEENTYTKVRKSTGLPERSCKTCSVERYKRIWSDPEKKAAFVARNNRWRIENPEKIRAQGQKYFANNTEKIRERNRIWRRNKTNILRKEAIEAYGGKCVWCGDSREEVLHFDHVNNDGYIHRKQEKVGCAADIYIWAKRNGYPDRLQLLCANCHNMKSFYGMTREDVVNDEALIGAGC